MTETAAPARRLSRRSVVLLSCGAVALLVLAFVAWVGLRGWTAKGELEAAAAQAERVQSAITEGDAQAATDAAASLARHASAAEQLTSDPIWRVAESFGDVGANLAAVRLLASALDEAATGAIQPLAGLTTTVNEKSFQPVDGRVQLQPLLDARPVVAGAREAIQQASDKAESVPRGHLLGPVESARVELTNTLQKADGLIATLDEALAIAPVFLGADGPRNYLLLFQNNAELRSAGGIPGALALIHADAGGISLVSQHNTTAFRGAKEQPTADYPLVAVAAETSALYGDLPGRFIQDVTMTPYFEQTARLAQQMWAQRVGGTVDGVIAVDPVALGYLLKATGPVALPDGRELTAENAAQLLLRDTYTNGSDSEQQDAFFAGAAAAVFSKLSEGSADPKKLIAALGNMGAEHRIALWSADEAVQKRIAATTLAGLAEAQALLGDQAYGLYFNDGTGGKMSSYLDVALQIGGVEQRDDGRADVTVRATLTNTAPADAATTLPALVTGGGWYGVQPGSISTNVFAYAPIGAFDAGVQRDGAVITYGQGSDSGHIVNSLGVSLLPGESTIVEFHFISAEPGQLKPQLVHTPFGRSIEVGAL